MGGISRDWPALFPNVLSMLALGGWSRLLLSQSEVARQTAARLIDEFFPLATSTCTTPSPQMWESTIVQAVASHWISGPLDYWLLEGCIPLPSAVTSLMLQCPRWLGLYQRSHPPLFKPVTIKNFPAASVAAHSTSLISWEGSNTPCLTTPMPTPLPKKLENEVRTQPSFWTPPWIRRSRV